MRVPRLLEQLAIARASADYSAMLARLAKIDAAQQQLSSATQGLLFQRLVVESATSSQLP
jgi:type II secretory ATPase GspE/PulE/Tfp pilus assembly ATPase PilB-like protein